MNSATTSISTALPSGRRLFLVRLGWWVLFLLYAMFSVFSIWHQLRFQSGTVITARAYPYVIAINIIVDFISWLLAIILFRKRSNNWVIMLVSVMFFARESGYAFWFWVLQGLSKFLNPTNAIINTISTAAILAEPFDIFASAVNVGVLLTFPTGQWISPKANRLFWANIIVSIFALLIEFFGPFISQIGGTSNLIGTELGDLGRVVFRLVAGYLLFVHYRNMQNSVQRQQVKWIVVFFIGSIIASALLTLFYVALPLALFLNLRNLSIDSYLNMGAWAALPSSILSLGLVIAFSIAIFRYRLWDIDILINKTLVYSSLTALLGGLFLVSTALINYVISKWFGAADSSAWAAAISALPVATAFNPLRERLQKWVDRYFKPEEVDFSNSFIEFKPEVQEMLTTPRIIQILSEQVQKQLNVDFAKVYLLREGSNLYQVKSAPTSKEDKKLVLEEKPLTQLKDGKVVVDDDGIPYSLLVPLTVPRARIPDFLGVIVLGRRLNGKGYSTQILNNLQALGADAGKAIYLSRLSEQAKQSRRHLKK